jgi:hypothetical protein
MYPSADELIASAISDTNSWESRMDYQLVQEILGHSLTEGEWAEMTEALDDVVFETVMSFQK